MVEAAPAPTETRTVITGLLQESAAETQPICAPIAQNLVNYVDQHNSWKPNGDSNYK